mmetsp:Transcript_24308/g.57944  ORF Transcript_24308/g.57944 Transcript_24308/m.57944 type:complete len:100 (+) Transcript_24308:120-419(+)
MAIRENSAQPLLTKANQLLNQRFRVETVDGRTFVGEFTCMDKERNIILCQTLENSLNVHTGQQEERMIGQVMIPLKQRKSCEIEVLPNQVENFQKLLKL